MKSKCKVAVIGTVGVPACYGGFETLVDNLIDNKELDYIVFCSSKSYSEKLTSYKDASTVYININANGISSIFYDIISLFTSIKYKPDSILLLGVSGAIALPVFRLFSKAKIITNIDGLEWRRDKWGKGAKFFLKMSERIAVKFSDVIVSDNQGISDYVTKEYKKDSVTIAYGGDHANIINDIDVSHVLPYNEQFALSLCRIEPENNVHIVLDAFSKTSENLVFIGNWKNSEYGINLLSKYRNNKNITMLDPIYDVSILSLYRSKCKYYVHGHSAGGTNPSLVEIMHFSKLILAFDCNYNRYTTENNCYYFSTSDELINILNDISDSERYFCGDRMKKIAEKKYTWSVISNEYVKILMNN
ncbi:DUF1972 domain-containing protein [Pragia fontium]|nr:DUF1972 domain-containing protein [Pragia fontium]